MSKIIEQIEKAQMKDDVPAFGYYRIEVTARKGNAAQCTYAWSNPVFIRVE